MANQKRAEHGSCWPAVCSKTDLSILLGVSVRTLTDLAATGVLVPAQKKGTYLVRESVQNYVKKLQDVAAARAEEMRNPLAEEKLLTERVMREIQEMKRDEMRGKILSLNEVSESWSNFAIKVKSAFLSAKADLRHDLPHLTAFDADVIGKWSKRKLRELAQEVEDSVIASDPKELRGG